jgi:hypothetical protein
MGPSLQAIMHGKLGVCEGMPRALYSVEHIATSLCRKVIIGSEALSDSSSCSLEATSQ